MHLSTTILGRSVVTAIRDRSARPLLQIGSDTFDRASLAKVACFNFTAAANLSKILNRELHVKNLREVYERIAPGRLVLKGLGAVSLAVLGAAFEAKGLGGSAPLESWARKHLPEGAELHTFASMKIRDQREASEEKKRTKTRAADRRNRAHKLRVSRYLERIANGEAPDLVHHETRSTH